MSIIDPDVMQMFGQQAGGALADRLERERRLRPGVMLDPDVATAFNAKVSGAHKFAMMNGADRAEAAEAMHLYATAMASALSFRVESSPDRTVH